MLFIGKNKTQPSYPTRVGFVVSKKIHKRAVKRNRIKRIMRETVRLNFNNYPLEKYQSLIFRSTEGIEEKTPQEIRNSILTLLNKLT